MNYPKADGCDAQKDNEHPGKFARKTREQLPCLTLFFEGRSGVLAVWVNGGCGLEVGHVFALTSASNIGWQGSSKVAGRFAAKAFAERLWCCLQPYALNAHGQAPKTGLLFDQITFNKHLFELALIEEAVDYAKNIIFHALRVLRVRQISQWFLA